MRQKVEAEIVRDLCPEAKEEVQEMMQALEASIWILAFVIGAGHTMLLLQAHVIEQWLATEESRRLHARLVSHGALPLPDLDTAEPELEAPSAEELTHRSVTPFVPVCGANKPGQHTIGGTWDEVTCPACIARRGLGGKLQPPKPDYEEAR